MDCLVSRPGRAMGVGSEISTTETAEKICGEVGSEPSATVTAERVSETGMAKETETKDKSETRGVLNCILNDGETIDCRGICFEVLLKRRPMRMNARRDILGYIYLLQSRQSLSGVYSTELTSVPMIFHISKRIYVHISVECAQ